MRYQIWASLATPSGDSRRHWMLTNGLRYIPLPIKYDYGNRFWMPIEQWLERHFYKYFDVSF